MNKKILIGLYIGMVCLFSFGCKKFLDTEPEDFHSPEQYYNTEAQLKTALAGIYDPLGSTNLYSYNISSMFGTEADEGYYYRSNIEGPQVYDYSTADNRIRATWQTLYEAIHRANMFLANADRPDMNESVRQMLIGEVRFLRAYYYFILVSNWGGVPLVLEPTDAPIGNNIARSTDAEIYDFILSEMEAAEEVVKTATDHQTAGRVNRSAVRGVLARVCLYMAGNPLNDISKYVEARKWASLVMESNEHELDPSYQDIFIRYAQDAYNIKESIWEVEFWGNGIGNAFNEGGWIGVRLGLQTDDEELGFNYGIMRTTQKYFELFEGGAYGDLRRDWTIAPFKYVNSDSVAHTPEAIYDREIAKWRRIYELETKTRLSPQNFPLLRYSDVLLMFAEADNAVNGPTQEAINAVNAVRRRGYGKLKGERIRSITVNSGGTNYNEIPEVFIEGGGGTGAEAVAIVSGGEVTEIRIINPGTGYGTAAPTITLSGGGGSGATATATLTTITDADLNAEQTASSEEFLKAIKDERSRELGFEGLRKYDLIRWGEFLTTMKDMEVEISTSMAPVWAAKAFSNVQQKHLLFPIPIREISLNRSLTQNPLW